MPESLSQHVCSFYESTEQQVLLGLPMMSNALEEGARCIIIGDEGTLSMWEAGLVESGAYPRHPQSLSFWGEEYMRIPGGVQSLPMARHLWSVIERSLEDHPSVALAIDMNWVTGTGATAGQVCHLEATLDNLYLQEAPVKVLCQYPRNRLPADALHAGLRTHQVVLSGQHCVANPYYEAPRILECEPALNACSSDTHRVSSMIDGLR